MKIKAIITGATGMVGEGVLHEALNHQDVEEILVINRTTCGIKHPKLKEIIHSDFFDLSPIEKQMKAYNACFFCLGVSSVGMKKEDYYSYTYTLTMHMAKTLLKYNNDMTFCYVSGAGTNSSDNGRMGWASIKGKTENDLMKLPFRNVYAFRPGFMQPTKGLSHAKGYYAILRLLYPVFRLIIPKYVSTLSEIGLAMINSVIHGYKKSVLEVKDIVKLAKA